MEFQSLQSRMIEEDFENFVLQKWRNFVFTDDRFQWDSLNNFDKSFNKLYTGIGGPSLKRQFEIFAKMLLK
jgi:hypothetical protein